MAVALPFQTRSYVELRVVTAEAWGSPWTIRPMMSGTRAGFEVLRFSRVALPDEGTAVLQYHYGRIDQRDVDPADIPDLDQQDVRIQVRLSTGAWVTAWWGTCVAMRDECFPASAVHAGTREYHCVDALHRLRNRYLDRHGVLTDSASYPARRHPGYNAVDGRGDRAIGPSPFAYAAHTWPGAGSRWTDLQALDHALATSAEEGDPAFSIDETAGLLAGASAWEVRDLEPCRDFLTRVLDRRRGRGLAFLAWTEAASSDAAAGEITSAMISVRPQVRESYSVSLTGGGSVEVPGADAVDTVVDVDLVGDYRLGRDAPQTFQVADVAETHYVGVEVMSELLRLLVTLSVPDSSLAKRFTTNEETALADADPNARGNDDARFDHVWRWLGLPTSWDLAAGYGYSGSTRVRCDYRVDDSGSIARPSMGDAKDTSPLLVSILPRLPLYAGYDYSTPSPASFDSSVDRGELVELPVQAYLRVPGVDRWVSGEVEARLCIHRHGPDLMIRSASDRGRWRIIGDKSEAALQSRFDLDQLALTVGLELPHRVRSVIGLTEGRVKRLQVPGYHLWLAHPGAIYGLQTELADGGYLPLRGAAGASLETPGVLRDDRDALARLSTEAKIWYMRRRKTATWTLADCGFTDGWYGADANGDEDTGSLHAWPELGQVVAQLTYSGRTEGIGTPITRMDYDARAGLTTWATSWSDRDWR